MKHILNNLSNEEKNNIREQHTGEMKVMTKNFNKLINSKLGDSKPIVEQQPTPNNLKDLFKTPDEFPKLKNPQVPPPVPPPVPKPPVNNTITDLPKCEFKMLKNLGPGTPTEMSGAYTKITYNGAVEPQYIGYTVHTSDGPFCFIPIR
jgi:hypothetical protein